MIMLLAYSASENNTSQFITSQLRSVTFSPKDKYKKGPDGPFKIYGVQSPLMAI